jgi:hypothetical protein
MKGGHIVAVELLDESDDAGRIKRAMELFDLKCDECGAEGFEVWDGRRFVFRFPANLKTPGDPPES